MKQTIVLGNWKSHNTRGEAKAWVDAFVPKIPSLPHNLTLILCPAYHHIDLFLNAGLGTYLGVQNVSMYEKGAYTGEIAASMINDDVRYAMVGHSERRRYFGETDAVVGEKVKQSLGAGITPIVCISDISQVHNLKGFVPDFAEKGMLLYEPLFAVGTGNADSPEHADETARAIQEVIGATPILYGGSVDPVNVGAFLHKEHLSGVGVGGVSLDPEKFFDLIMQAAL